MLLWCLLHIFESDVFLFLKPKWITLEKFNILLNVFEIAYHRWKKTPIAIETEQGRKKEIEKTLVVLKG